MDRKYMKWICVAALMCVIVFFFLGAAPDPETVAVERLLEKRTDVMSNVLLDRISYEEGKQLLKEIESDRLYNDDLEKLQKYSDADIDMRADMKVIDLEKNSHLYDRMSFQAEISWQYSGEDGSFGYRDTYEVGVLEKNGEYRLVSFELK